MLFFVYLLAQRNVCITFQPGILFALPNNVCLCLGLSFSHLFEHDVFISLRKIIQITMSLVIAQRFVLLIVTLLEIFQFQEVFGPVLIILCEFLNGFYCKNFVFFLSLSMLFDMVQSLLLKGTCVGAFIHDSLIFSSLVSLSILLLLIHIELSMQIAVLFFPHFGYLFKTLFFFDRFLSFLPHCITDFSSFPIFYLVSLLVLLSLNVYHVFFF